MEKGTNACKQKSFRTYEQKADAEIFIKYSVSVQNS